MAPEKKVVSKGSGGELGEVRKSILFEGASSDSVGGGGQRLPQVEEDVQKLAADHQVVGHENSGTVSFCLLPLLFSLAPNGHSQFLHNN